MDQTQLLDSIKNDVAAINTALNRALTLAAEKLDSTNEKVLDDLLEMQSASENLRIAAEQFERGAERIGKPLPEKVA